MDTWRDYKDDLPDWKPAPNIWRTATRIVVGILLGAFCGLSAWTVAEQFGHAARNKAVIQQVEAPKPLPGPVLVEEPADHDVEKAVIEAPVKPRPVIRDVSAE